MDGRVVWKEEMLFEGVGKSGFVVPMDSEPSLEKPHSGPSPMELIALSLAGCTAMDVISILRKKRADVTAFEVKVHADRATEYPKVFTHAVLDYQVTGHALNENAVVRSIELSVEKYCPAHVMLSQVFPIDVHYSIFEDEGNGAKRVVAEGTYMPLEME
ncbi:MAG: OsmC family protein [Anaerolineales bacterium]|nr:OsmC family protein [Anaerolineales bacterium]